MYKLHKISQRFLCRIPIDSKQGAPGPPARLCATMCVYSYPGTPTLYPWHPMPTTYIHTCIDTFVLFIYLSYCLCVCLSYCLCLSYSSLLSCSLSSRSLLALGKACPWAEAAGLISLVYANVLFYLIIIQQYTCVVWYVCISVYCIVYVYTSCTVYVSNRCMYVHSVVCIVL